MQPDPCDPEPRTNPIAKDQSLDAALTAIQYKHWVRRRLAAVPMAPSVNDAKQWPFTLVCILAMVLGFLLIATAA